MNLDASGDKASSFCVTSQMCWTAQSDVGSGCVCKQQSQTTAEIRGGDTVAVVTLTTVQCSGCRAAHAQ